MGINKPTVISLFAGCGGSSLGYQMAGFKELLAIDFNKNAVETFKLNFLDIPIWEKDLKLINGKEILEFCNLKSSELDILDSSPPCQGFSIAGKKNVNDNRNDLYLEFIRLINELQPKVFIMENVSGLIKGKMKGKFKEIILNLKSLNYQIKCNMMNTKYFNVPQSRERLIFIGIRNDLNIQPEFPNPQNIPKTFKEVCWDLRGNNEEDRMLNDLVKEIAKYQPNKWSTEKKIYKKIKGNLAGSISLRWACWNKVCGTIVKSEIGISGIVHPDRERYISLNEAKRLSSFPDNFEFLNRKTGIERIGNSVPPEFMRIIAEYIKKIMNW